MYCLHKALSRLYRKKRLAKQAPPNMIDSGINGDSLGPHVYHLRKVQE